MSTPTGQAPPLPHCTPEWRHCWHYPRGFRPETFDLSPLDPPYTVTCCNCAAEAEVGSFNKRWRDHGPHRQGEPMEHSQARWRPVVRILPREAPRA